MERAALVTGAGRRIGRAMALDLARAGFDVAVHNSTSRDDAEATAAEARGLGVAAVPLRADLLDSAQVADLVPRAAEALGRPLGVLVNNASIFEHDTIRDATAESWDRAMGSNLRAPFFLTQAFAGQVPGGARDSAGEPVASALVVNMIDQRVRRLTPFFASYTLAKAALWTLTQTAAQALAPDIRVVGIGPGPTVQGERQSAGHFARQRAATILGRGSDPAEVCRALRFALDSPGLTGQLLCLDGGQHLAWQTPDVLGVE